MITKTYNPTTTTDNRGRIINHYLRIKGKRYDREYSISVQPMEQEQGSPFESMTMFSGISARLHAPARWSDKKVTAYDNLVAEYMDKLAESFTAGAQAQKEATPASLNYVYRAENDPATVFLIRELQAKSATL